MKVFSIWRCAGSAGVRLSVESGKDANERLCRDYLYPDGVSPKKKAITAYLRKHPGVTNKAKIARDLNMDRTTVQRYYDEIRAELRGE